MQSVLHFLLTKEQYFAPQTHLASSSFAVEYMLLFFLLQLYRWHVYCICSVSSWTQVPDFNMLCISNLRPSSISLLFPKRTRVLYLSRSCIWSHTTSPLITMMRLPTTCVFFMLFAWFVLSICFRVGGHIPFPFVLELIYDPFQSCTACEMAIVVINLIEFFGVVPSLLIVPILVHCRCTM